MIPILNKMVRLTNRDKAEVMRLMREGATDKEIKTKFELNHEQVRYWRRKTETSNPKGPPPAPNTDLFKEEEKEEDIVQEQAPENKFQCGRCSGFFDSKVTYCPHCGVQLGWQ